MWISISNIIFYITCFKGCITSKRDLAMEYVGYTKSYASFNGCVDNYVVEVCRSGGYGIVVSHSLIYDSA